jgi:sulfide:quinone oxidoreductase
MSHHVVIGGGGVGALEGLLALQALSPRFRISVLCARRRIPYPARSVTEPFGGAAEPRYDWAAIARDRGVEWIPDTIVAVDAERRAVETRDGPPLRYDALLLALGARPRDALPGALTFAGPRDVLEMREALDGLPPGATVAFVAPDGVGWTLPLYELALQAAGRHDAVLVTPEPAPLAALGAATSGAVAARLAAAGVALRTDAHAVAAEPGRLILASGAPLRAALVIALPRLAGPALPGLPHDADGFVPADDEGRVVPGAWAVGDMTARALKQGGLAAQQADVAAASIAAAAGEPVTVEPYRPVLRGLLVTADEPRAGESKVAGRLLGPYLAALDEAATT